MEKAPTTYVDANVFLPTVLLIGEPFPRAGCRWSCPAAVQRDAAVRPQRVELVGLVDVAVVTTSPIT